MSIRPTLLLILALTMGVTMWLTYTWTIERGKVDSFQSDVENNFDDASRILELFKMHMGHLFLITDLANLEQISRGPVLLRLFTETHDQLPQLVKETEQAINRLFDEFKLVERTSDQKRFQDGYEAVNAAFAELKSVLTDYDTALSYFIDEVNPIGPKPLNDVERMVLDRFAVYEESMNHFRTEVMAITMRLLKANSAEVTIYGVVALILLTAFIYLASNAIATPLERLSLASESAMPPGGEFKYSKGEFRFKEEQVLATAIESLVAVRNEQEHDLEAKVIRRDAELAHLSGMDQLGNVAGNVAHDFANFLTIVIGYAEISLKKELSDDLRKNIELILDAANGGKGVTEQLLKISRRSLDDLNPVAIDPSSFVEQMEPLWKPFLGANIQMVVESHGEVGQVFIEDQALTQIIMNLVTNARDAMPDGGQIKIAVWNGSEFKEHPKPAHLDPTTEYSVIEVADEGTGIPDSMLEKLYQPYESTKDKGKGTGFGLSIVHNMVHDAGGGISFATEQGVGTTFQIWLPKFVATESNLTELNPAELNSAEGARLLLIEDEAALREIATLALEAEGHDVTSAASGVVAIENHEDDLLSFDAVISDIRMPGMDGDEVIKRFRKQHRSLPVLFISAHSFREIEENLESSCPTLFLQKPFSIEDLNSRVHQLLELKHG